MPVEPSSSAEPWPRPQRILLLTYNRAEHMVDTLAHSVVGVRADRAASVEKARRIRPGDWVLIRNSDLPGFRSSKPARVIAKPLDQKAGSPYPDFLWADEREQEKVLFPLRVPVTFEGGPSTTPGCINWESLAALKLRGKDGYILETPQQWGKKFAGNVLDAPDDVARVVDLVQRCAG